MLIRTTDERGLGYAWDMMLCWDMMLSCYLMTDGAVSHQETEGRRALGDELP